MPAPLDAFVACLESEREWRNIQTSVKNALDRVAAVLVAQERRLTILESTIRETAASNVSSAVSAETLTTRLVAHEESLTRGLMERVEDTAAAAREHARATADAMREELLKQLQELTSHQQNELRQHDARHHELFTRWREEHARDLVSATGGLVTTEQLAAVTSDVKRLDARFRDEGQSRPTHEEVMGLVEMAFDRRRRADHENLQQKLALKASAEDVDALSAHVREEATAVSKRLEEHHQRLVRKAESIELERLKTNLTDLVGIVETIQKEQEKLQQRLHELGAQEDERARVRAREDEHELQGTVTRLHDGVRQLRKHIETTVRRGEHEALVDELTGMRRQLRSELYQARYLWKHGRTSPEQAIVWSAEAVNTSPDVFVWRRGGDAITTVVPGLYHLQLAVFTRDVPTLQILVNDEPAIIDEPDEGPTTPLSSLPSDRDKKNASLICIPETPRRRRSRRLLVHSAGDIVAQDLSVFVALPARAVLKITYVASPEDQTINDNNNGIKNNQQMRHSHSSSNNSSSSSVVRPQGFLNVRKL